MKIFWDDVKDWMVVWRWPLLISLALLGARVGYWLWISPYGLAPDEAQYWHWLSHNDWSFLTKPPLTTWAMGVSTWLLGTNILGVKAFALLGQALVPLLVMGIASRLGGQKYGKAAGWLGFWAAVTCPLVSIGGMMMVPDALLLPLWLGALWLAVVAVEERRVDWGIWLGMGVLVGLAGLAKPSAAAFFPLLFIALLVVDRAVLWRPHFWVAGVVALGMQAPVIYWNMTHDWAMLGHLLWQVDGGEDGRHGGLRTLGDFLGGQLGLVGVTALPLMVWAWWQTGKHVGGLADRQGVGVVWWLSFPIFAFFLLQATDAKVQPNWPLLGTVPALVLMAYQVGKLAGGRVGRRLWWVVILGGGFMGLLAVPLHHTPWAREMGISLKLKIDPTRPMLGNKEFGEMTGVLMQQLASGSVVLTTRYQTAAVLAFHTPQRPEVLYVNPGYRRANQYDLWAWPDLTNKIALYVNEQSHLPDIIKAKFKDCLPWQRGVIGTESEPYYRPSYWICYGYKNRARN